MLRFRASSVSFWGTVMTPRLGRWLSLRSSDAGSGGGAASSMAKDASILALWTKPWLARRRRMYHHPKMSRLTIKRADTTPKPIATVLDFCGAAASAGAPDAARTATRVTVAAEYSASSSEICLALARLRAFTVWTKVFNTLRHATRDALRDKESIVIRIVGRQRESN